MSIEVTLVVSIIGAAVAFVVGLNNIQRASKQENERRGERDGIMQATLENIEKTLTSVNKTVSKISNEQNSIMQRLIIVESEQKILKETTDRTIVSLHERIDKFDKELDKLAKNLMMKSQ